MCRRIRFRLFVDFLCGCFCFGFGCLKQCNSYLFPCISAWHCTVRQFTSWSLSIHSTLFSHLLIALPSCLFPQDFSTKITKKNKMKVTFKASTTGYLSVCTSLGEDRILVHHHFLNKEVVLWKVSQNEAKTTYQVCRLLFVVPRVVCLYAEHA